MTWLPNNMPPHFIVALHQPEVRESLEKVINNHLDLCAECREWKAGNVNADWRRWIADR